MSEQPATVTGTAPPPAARLEPDAIGVAQDTVIGMASSAPAVSVGLTLAALTKGWLSLSGVGGHGSVAAGLLLAVFIFSGWEGTLYVNEETKHRRTNPGRAAILAVVILTIIYTLSVMGLQGAVSPARLQAHSTSALIYVAQAIGGSTGWAKVMALSLALSVIAATLTNIVLTARITYGMASYRTLPDFLANVSRRFKTPAAASIVVGVLLIALTWVYLIANSIQNAFTAVINVSGLLFAAFYILTGLATIVYYWRRVFSSVWDALILGILPLAAAGFLGWIIFKSVQAAPMSQIWSLIGVGVLGLILMFIARFVLHSQFFQTPRESDPGTESAK